MDGVINCKFESTLYRNRKVRHIYNNDTVKKESIGDFSVSNESKYSFTKENENQLYFSKALRNSLVFVVSHIAQTANKYRKYLWALILASTLLRCSYQIHMFTKLYFEYPVIFSLNIKHMQSLDFPAVTVCNVNRMDVKFRTCLNDIKTFNSCVNSICVSNANTARFCPPHI